MTVRTFEAEDIVRLPRMTTTDSIALATALVTRAEAAPELPPSIARELGRMRRSLEVLREGAEARVQEQGQSDSKEVWNRFLDSAWAALRWWCKGWSLLPHPEHAGQAALARRLEAVLFSDGLRFTMLPFRTQWVESQTRLGIVEKESLDAVITGLGGELILAAVRKAHDDFGRALGLTEATETPPSTTPLRDSRDDLAAHAAPLRPAGDGRADRTIRRAGRWPTICCCPSRPGRRAPPRRPTPARQPRARSRPCNRPRNRRLSPCAEPGRAQRIAARHPRREPRAKNILAPRLAGRSRAPDSATRRPAGRSRAMACSAH